MAEEQDEGDRGGYKRFPRSYFAPKPVKAGDELELEILELSRRGEGVAKVDGYIVFVPDAKPGDKKRVRIVQTRPDFAIGEVA